MQHHTVTAPVKRTAAIHHKGGAVEIKDFEDEETDFVKMPEEDVTM